MKFTETDLATLKQFIARSVRDAKMQPEKPIPILGVDGAAAVGKGTLMKSLRELGYITFSKGELFRALAWIFVQGTFDLDNLEPFYDKLQQVHFSVEIVDQKTFIHIECDQCGEVVLDPDSDDPRQGLRTPEISKVISQLSEDQTIIEMVNSFLIDAVIQAHAAQEAIAIEGRDNYDTLNNELLQTQHWFDSTLLLYLAASPEVLDERAIKRANSHRAKRGLPPAEEEETKNIVALNRARNQYESSRKLGKLFSPEEAEQSQYYDAVIDTTELSPQEVLYEVLKLQAIKLLTFSSN